MSFNFVLGRMFSRAVLLALMLAVGVITDVSAASVDPRPIRAPSCVGHSSGWRYTFVTNGCTRSYHVRVRYAHGDSSSCRIAASGATLTFAGHGLDRNDVVAIELCDHVGSTVVVFNVNASTFWGQNVYLVGSDEVLGSSDTGRAVRLSPAAYPVWSAAVALPAGTTIQYRYFKENPDLSLNWMSGPDLSHTIRTDGRDTIGDVWC